MVYSIVSHTMEFVDINLDEPSHYYDFPGYAILKSSYYVINNITDKNADSCKIISYYSEDDKLVGIIELSKSLIESHYYDNELFEQECQKCLNIEGFKPSLINIKGNQDQGYHLEYYNSYGMKIASHILHTQDGKRPCEKTIKKSSLKSVIEYNQKNRGEILNNDYNFQIGKFLIQTLEKQTPNYEWILNNSDKIKCRKEILK